MQCKEALVIIQTHNFSFPHHQCRWQWILRSGVTPCGRDKYQASISTSVTDIRYCRQVAHSLQHAECHCRYVPSPKSLNGETIGEFQYLIVTARTLKDTKLISSNLSRNNYRFPMPQDCYCICCKNYDQIN